MSLQCIYHRNGKMEVVEGDVAERMISSGEWYDHPLKAKKAKENKHEEQIRQHARQRIEHSKQPSQKARS